MDGRPRLLYLAHRVPHPPDKGDRIRNFHVLRELAKVGRVWLAALADEPVSAETRRVLEQLCERVEFVPAGGFARRLKAAKSALLGGSLSEGLFRNVALGNLVKVWANEAGFAAALVSASSLAQYLRPLGGLPRFVDLVDVDSQKWFDYAAASGGMKGRLHRFEGGRVRALEIELSRWAKGVFIVSRAECDVYDGFAAPAKGTVATNGVDLEYFAPRPGAENTAACAFVGAMDYHPNVDGAVWFARDIWPTVLARRPAAEFWVIGRKPVPQVKALAALPGVKLFPDVPDVRPYLARAAVAVCPIRIARGLQNKVLEAMAMGKATAAAPAAVAALGTTVGQHLLSPASPAEWADQVAGLLESPDRRAALGAAARSYVEAHHHWDRCLKTMLDALAPHLVPR